MLIFDQVNNQLGFGELVESACPAAPAAPPVQTPVPVAVPSPTPTVPSPTPTPIPIPSPVRPVAPRTTRADRRTIVWQRR